jgi:pSer/pThr/pTyr-binding forkhead associated (FHA) protein
MDNEKEKTIRTKSIDIRTYKKEKTGFSSTLEMSPKTFIGKIPTTQHAYLEIMGEKKERIYLGENEVVIGRIPDCDIQLLVDNVSRMHARIIYRNEEYQIEDLGSMNGVYVNGIKVEKCILREHDIIEIGGVKILFVEEKVRQDHDSK